MPVHDLLGFERAEPEVDVVGVTPTKTVTTWADAVAALWVTPLPRVIVCRGGGRSFDVLGGDGLAFVAAPVKADAERRDVMRLAKDTKPTPVLPAQTHWVDCNPANTWSEVDQSFECYILSGHLRYAAYSHATQLYYLSPFAASCKEVTDPTTVQPGWARWTLWLTGAAPRPDAAAAAKTNVPVARGPPIVAGGGAVEVEVMTDIHDHGCSNRWKIYRCTGDTMLREAGDDTAWNAMAYGWMLHDVAQPKAEHFLRHRAPYTSVPDGDVTYLGCFQDRGGDRAMPHNPNIGRDIANTVAKCGVSAAILGKRLFSVQAGGDCWTGNDDEDRARRHGGSDQCVGANAAGMNVGGANTFALYRSSDQFMNDNTEAAIGARKVAEWRPRPAGQWWHYLDINNLSVTDEGCWSAPDGGPRYIGDFCEGPYHWNPKDCAFQAALRSRHWFATEAGNEGDRCWIPKDAAADTANTRQILVGRTGGINQPCVDDGSWTPWSFALRFYSMDEPTRARINDLEIEVGARKVATAILSQPWWADQGLPDLQITDNRCWGAPNGGPAIMRDYCDEYFWKAKDCAYQTALRSRHWFAIEKADGNRTRCWIPKNAEGDNLAMMKILVSRTEGENQDCAKNSQQDGWGNSLHFYSMDEKTRVRLNDIEIELGERKVANSIPAQPWWTDFPDVQVTDNRCWGAPNGGPAIMRDYCEENYWKAKDCAYQAALRGRHWFAVEKADGDRTRCWIPKNETGDNLGMMKILVSRTEGENQDCAKGSQQDGWGHSLHFYSMAENTRARIAGMEAELGARKIYSYQPRPAGAWWSNKGSGAFNDLQVTNNGCWSVPGGGPAVIGGYCDAKNLNPIACAELAALQGRRWFAMEQENGNDRCWIPKNESAGSLDIMNLVTSRTDGLNQDCDKTNAMSGWGYALRVFSMDDATRARIANIDVTVGEQKIGAWQPRPAGQWYEPTDIRVTDNGCWSAENGGPAVVGGFCKRTYYDPKTCAGIAAGQGNNWFAMEHGDEGRRCWIPKPGAGDTHIMHRRPPGRRHAGVCTRNRRLVG